MRDIWEEQLQWLGSGEPFVLARVIRTWRSAPRKTGAGMLIGKGMRVAGSVSGGCIEGAVIEEALEVLERKQIPTIAPLLIIKIIHQQPTTLTHNQISPAQTLWLKAKECL